MLVSIGISIVMTVGATIAVALWTQNGNESEGNIKNYFIMKLTIRIDVMSYHV